MNTPQVSQPRLRWALPLLIPALLLVMLSFVIWGVMSFFRLGADAGSLRNSLVKSSSAAGVTWHKKIELSAGTMTCQLVRAGFCLAPLQPDAKDAIRALHGAEVAVYHRDSQGEPLNMAGLLQGADETMAERGWDRLVGVAKERDLVAVYTPREPSGTRLRSCVAVMHGRDLVVVSAHANLEPLMELALRHSDAVEGSFDWNLSEPSRAPKHHHKQIAALADR